MVEDKKRRQDYKIAVLFLFLSAFSFATMAIFVRLSGDLPTVQKAFFRNIVALLVAGVVVRRKRGGLRIKKESFSPLLLRCVTGTIGMLINFWAIDRLGIADAGMLQKMSPFFIVILGIFILGEKANALDFITVLFALAGVAFVVKPTEGVASVPAFIGLIGGFFTAMAYIMVRKLGTLSEKKELIVFYFSLFSTLITLPFMLFSYQMMSGRQILILIAAGCMAALAQFTMTFAYSKAAATDITIFDYSQVLFAAFYGTVIFQEIPDQYSLIGYTIIIGAATLNWKLKKAGE